MCKMMSKISGLFLFAALSCLSLAGAAQADMLLGWDFTAAGPPASTTGAITSVNSTTTAANVQPGTITSGSGMTVKTLNSGTGKGAMNDRNTFQPIDNGLFGWNSANLAAAKTNNAYFQWSIAPVGGYEISLSSLDLVLYVNTTIGTVAVEYSLDGFATAGTSVGTISGSQIGAGFTGKNTNLNLAGFSNLQNATATVTFRAYGYGFAKAEDRGFGEITGNNTDVGVNGTVAEVIPEPTTLGLMAIGGLLMIGRKR